MSKSNLSYRGFKYRPVARKKFSNTQQDMLSEMFNTNPYPDRSTRTVISNNTGLDVEQIRVWFQNKRARERTNLQKGTGTNSPTKAAKPSAIRNNQKDSGTGEICNISPSDTNPCKSIVDILRYCEEALSGRVGMSARYTLQF